MLLVAICISGLLLAVSLTSGFCQAAILMSSATLPDLVNSARQNVSQFKHDEILAYRQERAAAEQAREEGSITRQAEHSPPHIVPAPLECCTYRVQREKYVGWADRLASQRVRLAKQDFLPRTTNFSGCPEGWLEHVRNWYAMLPGSLSLIVICIFCVALAFRLTSGAWKTAILLSRGPPSDQVNSVYRLPGL